MPPRVVILTALRVEYMAVRSYLTDLQEKVHSQGTIYEQGKFATSERVWEVGIAEVGAGNAIAAIEAERAITHFKPNVLFFVGIAGGIKDVEIGDVVAATKVYGYESGRVGEQFSTRPEVRESAYALVERAKAEAKKADWLQRLSNFTSPPRVFVAPIAAGEKVIASRQAEIFRFLRTSYEDAIAVEMEGFGFLRAAFANQEVNAIVIRGISNLIEVKNDESPEFSQETEQIRQEKASHHASAFAFEILAKLQVKEAEILKRGSKEEERYRNKAREHMYRSCIRQGKYEIDDDCRNDLNRIIRRLTSKGMKLTLDQVKYSEELIKEEIEFNIEEIRKIVLESEAFVSNASFNNRVIRNQLEGKASTLGISEDLKSFFVDLVYAELGEEMLQCGEYSEAIRYFKKAVDEKHQCLIVSCHTGLALAQLKLAIQQENWSNAWKAKGTILRAKHLFRSFFNNPKNQFSQTYADTYIGKSIDEIDDFEEELTSILKMRLDDQKI